MLARLGKGESFKLRAKRKRELMTTEDHLEKLLALFEDAFFINSSIIDYLNYASSDECIKASNSSRYRAASS